jgi:hypothetical protein
MHPGAGHPWIRQPHEPAADRSSDVPSPKSAGSEIHQVLASRAADPATATAVRQMPGQQDPNLQDRKNDFIGRDGASDANYLQHSVSEPPGPDEVNAGTIMPTILLTGLNSDLPGEVVGQVRESVYDTVTGNYLLIPQGSRLLAKYDSMVAFGQERVLICWNRLIRPDGTSVNLERMPGVDLAGYAGFADQVAHHWWRILSGIALGSLLGAATQASQGNVSGLHSPPSLNSGRPGPLARSTRRANRSPRRTSLCNQPSRFGLDSRSTYWFPKTSSSRRTVVGSLRPRDRSLELRDRSPGPRRISPTERNRQTAGSCGPTTRIVCYPQSARWLKASHQGVFK